MCKTGQEAYLEERILSAGPLELVQLLYQAAIAAMREARRALAGGDIATRSRAISKACGIVIELNGALDHSRGGDLSARLSALYDYILSRLMEANIRQSDALLAEVLGLLCTLAEAWEQVGGAAETAPAEAAWPLRPELVSGAGSQVWRV